MTREEAIKRLNWVREQIDEKPIHYTHQALDMAIKALNVPDMNIGDMISRQAAIDALGEEPEVRSDNDQYDQYDLGLNNQWWDDVNAIKGLPPAQPETTKEYNLKNIYNIYVKIAQAHFLYQPSKPKTITAMPFDWIETQNLLEKYLKDHGADFDALCREYISENVKDDYLPFAQPDVIDTNVGDTIGQAVHHLDLFTKKFCRDKSVTDNLVFRCEQCDFMMPEGTCLVKSMARRLYPDYKDFGSMGDL